MPYHKEEMAFDIAKLTPEPWEWSQCADDVLGENNKGYLRTPDGTPVLSPTNEGDIAVRPDDAEFISLARSDLAVKLRREWHTEKCETGEWCCPQAAILVIQHAWNSSGGTGTAPDSLPPNDDTFNNCYQAGHDVGLLTKADRWCREHIEKS